ncbi:MAG: thioredoxin-disulfide reductase [Alphaproteobacteria bacterium]|nr:thioredoxin-disulfide reductase [Alphaproteobacteria bacterium]
MAEYKTPVLIIGSGPAGYTAGIYTARAGLKPIIVSGEQIGGQLTITNLVENYPGFPDPILGTKLMEDMRQQAQNLGVEIINDKIVEIDFKNHPYECSSENHNLFSGQTIIIATGASARWLGLENETKYRGFGISVCATCDGIFFKNKNVAVIGGGNTAAEEALFLSNYADFVTIIHRRDSLRADKSLQEKIRRNHKIAIEWNSVVEDIIGKENPLEVTGLKIKNVKTDQTKILSVNGVFIAIGHHPNTEIFKGILNMDEQGYIITKHDSTQTNIPGIFAAGDVQSPRFRQAIVAAGSGCIAALEAEAYLLEQKFKYQNL